MSLSNSERTTIGDLVLLGGMVLAGPVFKFVDLTRDALNTLSQTSDDKRKKDTILSSITGSGQIRADDLSQDFLNLLNNGLITELEVKEAINIFLRQRAYTLFSMFFSAKSNGVKNGIPINLESCFFTEEDLQILAYGIKTNVINQIEQQEITFSNKGETLKTFVEKYLNFDIIEYHFNKINLLANISRVEITN